MGLRDDKWLIRYELSKKYYEYYGNLNIPQTFKTINGYEYDENGIPLGVWLSAQKQFYKKGTMSRERINLLKKIGVVFKCSSHDLKWQKKYNLALKYFKKHGNLNFGCDFKTKNGYEYDEKGENLSSWIHTQQELYRLGKLNADRYMLLERIGINFELSKFELNWEERYELAKKYYEHHGNLAIPRSFRTKDGIERNKKGISLGVWLNSQKEAYRMGTLDEKRKKLLEEIGFTDVLCVNDKKWLDNYELVKAYYEYYGHLEIPQNFRTSNGYEYDEKGRILNFWLFRQRKNYVLGKLDAEKIRLLEEINFNFDLNIKTDVWDERYDLAKVYYEHHGNLMIPQNFKTINGYEYNRCGINLGNWISVQRTKYREGTLSLDKFYKLIDINMLWDAKTKSKDLNCVCALFDIDLKLNRSVLRGLSYQELVAKILYLNSINIPIMNEGKLHEIFSMSSVNMQVNYGITLEELIDKYRLYEYKRVLNKK